MTERIQVGVRVSWISSGGQHHRTFHGVWHATDFCQRLRRNGFEPEMVSIEAPTPGDFRNFLFAAKK